jgi:hypothetical protein
MSSLSDCLICFSRRNPLWAVSVLTVANNHYIYVDFKPKKYTENFAGEISWKAYGDGTYLKERGCDDEKQMKLVRDGPYERHRH